MAYLTETDLTSLLFQERIDEIKRDSATFVEDKINAAIAEAKTFLTRFDLLKLFGDDVTPPTVVDQALKDHVIAIACYNMVKRTTAGVNIEEYRLYYEEAIGYLTKIQKGGDPEGWALKEALEDGSQPGQGARWFSNHKRRNHYD